MDSRFVPRLLNQSNSGCRVGVMGAKQLGKAGGLRLAGFEHVGDEVDGGGVVLVLVQQIK